MSLACKEEWQVEQPNQEPDKYTKPESARQDRGTPQLLRFLQFRGFMQHYHPQNTHLIKEHTLTSAVVSGVKSFVFALLFPLTLAFDPYSNGTYEITRFNIRRLTTLGLTENLDVWSPIEGETFPLLYLLDGFADIFPVEVYEDTMSHIATHGFVVVNAWRVLGSYSFEDKVFEFNETVDWCKAHLEGHIHKEGGASPDLVVNFTLTFGMGHSAGSHVLVQFLKAGCADFKGIILSSPVDGGNPSNTSMGSFCITPGTPLNFDTPAIVLPAGLDNVPGLGMPIPCAPDKLSNERFWDALNPSSPRWLVNATEYGHADYINQYYVDIIIETNLCAYKANGTIEDFQTYRSFFSGQVVSFLKSILEVDCETYLPFIEDTSAMPILTTGDYINPSGGCPTPYCTWTPENEFL